MDRGVSAYINIGMVVFLLLLFLCEGYRLLRNFNIIDFLRVEISRNDGVFCVYKIKTNIMGTPGVIMMYIRGRAFFGVGGSYIKKIINLSYTCK
jgi:hypothetical protein